MHNKVTKGMGLGLVWWCGWWADLGVIAYATKVLKELHESQVVAGKVAGMNTHSYFCWEI